MERSTSQKVLKVLSILSIIGAVLTLILAALMGFGGILFGAADPADTAEVMSEVDLTQTEVALGVGFITIYLVFAGAFSLVQGILGLRAAKDNQKIMPVWWISIINLVINAGSLALSLFNGSLDGENAPTTLATLAVAALTFFVANSIKKEAGK